MTLTPPRWCGKPRDDLLVLGAAALPLVWFTARELAVAGAPGFPLDDSWIHLHFARNLVEGAGFSYNPGVPVAGSTAPAWTLLLALGAWPFGTSLLLAKTLGVMLALATALVTRRAALAWGASRGAALTAAVALAWSGPLAWGALSGMEPPLAAALVGVALWAHARGHVPATALAAALATVARPEALLLVPLLVVAGPLSPRRFAWLGGVTALVLVPAIWFSLATVGSAVPATAAAKVEGGLLGWLGGVREPWGRTLLTRPWEFLSAWAVWLTGVNLLLALALPLGLRRAWRRSRVLGLASLALLVHPLGMALLAPYRDPSFQEGRYSIHLLPLAAVLAALAIASLPWPRALGAALCVAGLVAVVPAAERYAWGVQNINAMQVHFGRWVSAHVPPGTPLALNDIGAIAYVSRRPVVDLMGLVTPDILPYRREGENGVIRYVLERCPPYVIVFPEWFPRLTGGAVALEPLHRVRLARNEVAGAREMVAYRLRGCDRP